VAVWLGAVIVWEEEVDIPATSGAMEAFIPIEQAPSEDARLGLHLHNHGFNSWQFYDVILHR